METETKPSKTSSYSFLDAAIVFVIFLFVGALPGVLYGGYLGLVVAHSVLGTPNEGTVLARMLIGSGMVLGFSASLALFLVTGAAVRATVGAALKTVTQPPELEGSEVRALNK
jgi:hypothetical protein